MILSYRLGILGYPLSHSLSPVLHSFFMEKTGLTGSYETLPITPADLPGWMRGDQGASFHGLNVTVPHKTAVLNFLADLSPVAKAVGAVNTLTQAPQGWMGDNTDVSGFLAAFTETQRQQLANTHVLILGAGGASRAIVYALLQLNVKQLTVWARDNTRLELFIQEVRSIAAQAGQTAVSLTGSSDIEKLPWPEFSAVIHTTPVGMSPQTGQNILPVETLKTLRPGTLVYDLIYNPLETRLIQDAKNLDLPTINGLPMLIHQGADAFEIWTGQKIAEPIRRYTLERLRQELN